MNTALSSATHQAVPLAGLAALDPGPLFVLSLVPYLALSLIHI